MSLQDVFQEDLRAIVTNYPLASLVLAALVAVPIFAIAGWIYKRREEHLHVKFNADMSVAERALRDRIAELERNYSQVVVEVGKSNLVWDHLGTLIPKSEIMQLSAQHFRGYSGGGYYLADFDRKDWKYQRCSRFDVLSSIGVAEFVPPQIVSLLKNIECDAWTRPTAEKVAIELASGDKLELNIFPYILAQRISAAQVRSAAAALQGREEVAAVPDSEKLIEEQPEHAIKDALVALEDLRKKGNGTVKPQPQPQPRASAEALLDRLVDHELATMVLTDSMTGELALSRMSSNLKYSINSVQKKGNIFVLDTEKHFGGGGEKKDVEQRSLRELIFFIGGVPDSLVVTASIPSKGGLSEDVPWVGEWLANLRVPI